VNPLEFIGELCTLDSALIRGWRCLFSATYRASIRTSCKEHHPLLIIAAVIETALFMVAEIVAVILLVRWALRS